MSNNSKKIGSLFWGVLMIGMGVLFLLDNLYIVDFGEVISDYWPLILIAVGLKIILSAKGSKKSKEPTTEVQQAEVTKTE